MTSIIVPQLSIFSPAANKDDHDDYPPRVRTQRQSYNIALPILQHAYIRSPVAAEAAHWERGSTFVDQDLEPRHSFSEDRIARRSHQFSFTRYSNLERSIVEEGSDMAAEVAIETAPNSPPELSFSKSSKSSSSSLRSSSIEDAETDSATESPHFEELSLDDSENAGVLGDSNLKPESRPTLRRPPQPRSVSSLEAPFRTMMRGAPPHGLGSRKMSAPSMTGVLQDQSSNLPTGRTMRRGFSSYSSPNVAQYSGQRRLSGPHMEEAPSPGSPRTSATTTPRASHDGGRTSQAPNLVKRGSWHARRKTVAELEAEYNDDDEDVPDEAILENVPVSPMPGSMPFQSRFSRSPSPRVAPRSPSYTNLHSANVPKNARRPSAPPQLRAPRSPHMRRPPMLQHSNTVGAFPPENSALRRSKTWNDDLNDEVRQLSMALEQFAEKSSAEQRSAPSSINSTPRRHSETKAPRVSVAELPPLQKGNIMIDPLPVSKEKEAVLTRTRPSWLPPKSQKEEKKHLKEWQQMMARAAKAEREREIKENEIAEQREGISIESVWEQEILLNWGTAKAESKKMELRWQGIAPASRGALWKKAVGNDLQLSSTSFLAALNRARRLEEKLDSMASEELPKNKTYAWFSAIERDVPAVFAATRRFAPGSPANQALSDVLKAYAMYRSDVGYVYGTHLIAGLLCLHMAPGDAFVVLANLLNRPLPLGFLIHDETAMGKTYEQVMSTLRKQHKKLHKHLTSPALDLPVEEYLDPLFRCLFAWNLSAAETARVWDVYLLGDDQVLIDAAVAALSLLEPRLYVSRQEVSDLISWRNQTNWELGGDNLMASVRKVSEQDSRP